MRRLYIDSLDLEDHKNEKLKIFICDNRIYVYIHREYIDTHREKSKEMSLKLALEIT